MPNVVNLGSPGDPRESPLSGMSDALMKGLEYRETVRSNKSREDITRQAGKTEAGNLEVRRTEAEMEKSRLSAALAKQSFDEAQANIENVRSTHEKFSMMWNDMDPQKQQFFKSTDQYKELQKFFKSLNNLVPGLVDDKGDITTNANKDIYETQIKKLEAQNAQVLASGGQLSEGQQQFQDMIDKVEPKILATVLDSAAFELEEATSPAEVQAIIKKHMDAVTQVRRGVQGGTEAENPMSEALSTSDPLGILGGR